MRIINRVFILVAVLCACVTSAYGQQRNYPYVDKSETAGPVIVSRDVSGGVLPAALAANGADGKASAGFQVGHTDAGNGAEMTLAAALTSCDSSEGWRLPTQRELQLIWLMGGADSSRYDDSEPLAGDKPLYDSSLFGDFNVLHAGATELYWTSTPGGGNMGWYVNMKYGSSYMTESGCFVRCVKSL